MIKKYKDYFTIAFSLLSLIIALLTFYLTRIKPFELDVIAGPTMHFYHPSGEETAFYLPVSFINVSDKNGLIVKLYMRLENPNGEVYYMRWREFAEYFWRSNSFENTGDAEPFALESSSSKTKLIWFFWPGTEQKSLGFGPGDYEISIYVWTENKEDHKLTRTERFHISDGMAKNLAEWKMNKNPASTYVHFSNQDSPVAFFPTDGGTRPWSTKR